MRDLSEVIDAIKQKQQSILSQLNQASHFSLNAVPQLGLTSIDANIDLTINLDLTGEEGWDYQSPVNDTTTQINGDLPQWLW